MAFIFPDSTIDLYSGIEITVGQEIAFSSRSQQSTYFTKHRVAGSVACTYVRKTGRLKVEFPTSTVAQCNFISFKNTSFENRVFYARILDYEYINNVTTEIRYAIDYFQSFCFDVTYEDSAIQREHLSEAGFTLSHQNPYLTDSRMYEMTTTEDFPCGKSTEQPVLNFDCYGDKITSSVGDNVRMTDRAIVLMVASFDTADFDYESFKNCFAMIIPPNGPIEFPNANPYSGEMEALTGLSGSQTFNPRFAHGVYLYISHSDDKENFKKALDWLTLQNLTQQIVGCWTLGCEDIGSYVKLNILSNSGYYESDLEEIDITPPFFDDSQPYVNTKLYRYPFQYLRVMTPKGDSKEYQYELFTNIGETDNQVAHFVRLFTIDDVPKASIIPENYKKHSNTVGTSKQYNIPERIVNSDFSQIGYNVDGYLTFLSNTYMGTLANTTDWSYGVYGGNAQNIANVAGMIGSLVNGTLQIASAGTVSNKNNPFAGAQSVAGSASNVGSSIVGSVNQMFLGLDQQQSFNRSYEVPGLSADEASAIGKGDTAEEVYGSAKPAYAADKYTPPQIAGVEPYYVGDGYGSGTFYFVYVTTAYVILEQLDKFFSLYGYTSNRNGVPRVCNYIKGSSDSENIPHWDTTTSLTRTYVKTNGMKVISTMKVISDYIEALFDAGVTFIKGDTL